MTADEHLAQAKERALEYWRKGELEDAVASMASDVKCNDFLALLAMRYVIDNDRDGVKRWIEGFR